MDSYASDVDVGEGVRLQCCRLTASMTLLGCVGVIMIVCVLSVWICRGVQDLDPAVLDTIGETHNTNPQALPHLLLPPPSQHHHPTNPELPCRLVKLLPCLVLGGPCHLLFALQPTPLFTIHDWTAWSRITRNDLSERHRCGHP